MALRARDRLVVAGVGDVEIVGGATGAFEIIADGRLVFSKLESGRFPTDQEVDAVASG